MVATDERVPVHILIYGPPAAGKLTVAQALSENHGLRLLDNHATLDPVLRLFPFGHPELDRTVETIRVTLYSAAARAGLSVVSTLVFAHPIDRRLVANLQEAALEAGGRMSFVQLRTRREVLEQRVLEASRQGSEKIKDLRRLHALLDGHDLVTPIHDDDLSIDNTHVSAEEAVGSHREPCWPRSKVAGRLRPRNPESGWCCGQGCNWPVASMSLPSRERPR